jgi:hypothetical protein
MKSPSLDYNQKRKMRKSLVVSQYLYESMKRSGTLTLSDVEGIIVSLRCNGIPNTGSFEGLQWSIEDCRSIIKSSMVNWLEPDKLVATVYHALNSESLISLPDGVEARWCGSCRQELPLSAFHIGQRWCKRCRSFHNFLYRK